jgi:tetratricopeptide (TPR) repeat protein
VIYTSNSLAESWTPERVRQWFRQRARSGEDDRRRIGPYHRAAAVLATFNPASLRAPGLGLPGITHLSQLLADSVVVTDGETPTRWSLKPEIRRLALGSFPDIDTLRLALSWNPRSTGDGLQQALDAYIAGTADALELQNETDLAWTSLVVTWLSGAPFAKQLALPNPDFVQRRLDFTRLIMPLHAMVGEHFRGRHRELRKITDFLLSEDDGDFAPKPLMITGFGGSGKTTLLSKILLEYIQGRLAKGAGPFVFLDFDRPSLSPQEPATLLAEAARQLAAQSKNSNLAAESLIVSIDAALKDQRAYQADEPLSLGQILAGNFGAVTMNELADAVNTPQWGDRSLLFILDSFEEVQYHSQKLVEHVWAWLSAVRDRIPRVRVIISGRAPVQIEGHSQPFIDVVPVDELDQDSAVAILEQYGVSGAVGESIYACVGGNPLALRLAGQLVKIESAAGTFEEFISTEFAERVQDELAQAILFRRILGHIKTREVRRLAHPGLTLRRITPELIREVLAEPCGIEVPDLARAQELWVELARETSLVLQESADALRHRPELRRQMIGLLRVMNQKQVDEIHRGAIRYYERFDDDLSRAEELYHRLSLNEPREVLDTRWRATAEPSLRTARDELPPEALAYLASRSVVGFEAARLDESATFWQHADLLTWERKTAQWARELLRQDRYEEVDKILRLRGDRSDNSPLFLLHAKVMTALRDYKAAARLLEQALDRWPEAASRRERLDLLLQLVRALVSLGQLDEARTRLSEASSSVAISGSRGQRLETITLEVRTAPRPGPNNEMMEVLAHAVDSWTDSQLREIPGLARDVAAELLRYDATYAARIIRSVGLGRLDGRQQMQLADFLAKWDARLGPSTSNGKSSLAYVAGLREQGAEAWRKWVRLSPPDEVAVRIARMLEQCPLDGTTLPNPGELQMVLGGWGDVLDRRIGEAGAAQQKLSEGEALGRVREIIVDAFDRWDLENVLRAKLDVALYDIVDRNSFNVMVFDLLKWAERHGTMAQLIRSLAEARPQRADIQQLLRDLPSDAN